MWNHEQYNVAQAILVTNAARCLMDDIRCEIPREGMPSHPHPPLNTSIPLFDALSPEQRIVLLDRAAGCVCDPEPALQPRNAVLEAAVAAIFDHIRGELEAELDVQSDPDESVEDDTEVRREIAAAFNEGEEEPGGLSICPDPECVVFETWEVVMDSLRDRILPDEDWNLSDLALDLSPEKSNELKQTMGIGDDYFVDVAPDATIQDAREAWANLVERATGSRPALWRFGDQDVNPVMLEDVTSSQDILPDLWSAYVNSGFEEVVMYPDEMIEFINSGGDDKDYLGDGGQLFVSEARKAISGNTMVEIPKNFGVQLRCVRRDFVDSIENKDHQEQLFNAIRQPSAFSAVLERLDCEKGWFDFRDRVLELHAIEWLNDNNIPWLRESDLQR